MAVLQMQRVSICALKKDRKAVLEKLQAMGVMEISHVDCGDDDFEKMDTGNARQGFERKAQLADHALEILERYVPEKRSMLSSLEGKKLIKEDQFRTVAADRGKIMEKATLLVSCNKEIAEKRADIQKLQNQIEGLTP